MKDQKQDVRVAFLRTERDEELKGRLARAGHTPAEMVGLREKDLDAFADKHGLTRKIFEDVA